MNKKTLDILFYTSIIILCIFLAGCNTVPKEIEGTNNTIKKEETKLEAPGVILWPALDTQMNEEIKEKIMGAIPLRRKGDPKDIAQTALFLATSASYITGQTIVVDGGSSI